MIMNGRRSEFSLAAKSMALMNPRPSVLSVTAWSEADQSCELDERSG